jgi:E3 ubiquitin-protein ligase DOA10
LAFVCTTSITFSFIGILFGSKLTSSAGALFLRFWCFHLFSNKLSTAHFVRGQHNSTADHLSLRLFISLLGTFTTKKGRIDNARR